jgi:signal transduction histidine kinase
MVIADPDLITIMLSNLIRNAWKFTAKVEHARIDLADCSEAAKRVFCLTDNGAGFDSSKAALIFRPFIRLHPDREFQGLGIGLAIAHRVIQRHGGSIWAEGETGKGATIHFTLGQDRPQP